MKRIVIVGAGALGSHVVMMLRNVDAVIRVVDFDRVEQKNVMSQFHSAKHVGQLKVDALKQSMLFLFGREVHTVKNRMTSDNAEVLLDDASFVIDCTDNSKSRWLIRETAATCGIPCLHAALAGSGDFARVGWAPKFTVDSDGEAGAPTCENGEFLPFIVMAAAHVAQAATQFLKNGTQRNVMVSSYGVQIVS